MMRIYGMKVINLTAGGLTDVRMFFSEARSKACREKSAEAIVDAETSLPVKGKRKAGSLTKC
jgi:hypothetical protein